MSNRNRNQLKRSAEQPIILARRIFGARRTQAIALAALVMLTLGSCSSEPAKDDAGATEIEMSTQALLGTCAEHTHAGKSYRFCELYRVWDEARSICQVMGMDLAVVNDAAENEFLRSHLTYYAWVGASDSATQDNWRWLDGTQFWSGAEGGSAVDSAYTNFQSGEPNTSSDHCLFLRSSDGEWQDGSCDQVREFACEAVPEPGLPSECETRTFEDHDYLFCDLRLEWAEARDACMAQGMDLAVIDSAAENAFVAANLPDTCWISAWIGANDSAQEGEWRWADTQTQFWMGDRQGAAVGGLYSNWNCYQPYEVEADIRDCAHIDDAAWWWVSSCTTDREYVCEKLSLCVPRTDAGVPIGEDVTCDGVDDDCDGLIDENYATTATTCGAGQCSSTGTKTCVAGAEQDSCEVGALGVDDVSCDGVDNNCDGSTDEGFVATSTACGLGICSATGATSCVAGAVQDSCVAGAALADDSSCDGLDGDCDGLVDEDYASEATACGVGACNAPGATFCVGGSVQDTCVAGAVGVDDNCDGVDDDCDGVTDEAYIPQPTACGVGACAANGQLVCNAGALVDSCASPAPAASDATCDAVDDDCDGSVDEEVIDVPSECGQGACVATGVVSCQSGALVDSCDPVTNCEGDCGNGTDDDGDGNLDCADSDCEGQPACVLGQACVEDADCTDVGGIASCVDEASSGVPGGYCSRLCGTADPEGPGCPEGSTCIDDQFCAINCDEQGACEGQSFCSAQDICGPCQASDLSCDGIDQDCSGTSDDGHEPTPTGCGVGACAASGQLSCQSGALVDSCSAGLPAGNDASCDGVDDDCDGAVDEGYVSQATGCGVGSCANIGATLCQAGVIVDTCAAGSPIGTDGNCDALDDDCDGLVDEAFVDTPTQCVVAGCTSTGVLICGPSGPEDTCLSTPTCQAEFDCTDGLDNDGDSVIDCFDPDCQATSPACLENCTDDLDNDGDGLSDCADSDCLSNTQCLGEVCGNTLDDDSDGKFDCADEDCANFEGCDLYAPRPEDVAPPLADDVATSLYEMTHFLYAGPSPSQFFMDPATIDHDRAGLLRGLVVDPLGNVLPGVRISVLRHPEYGESRTSDDGQYAMVVNGGEQLTLRYESAGYLPADRISWPQWQGSDVIDTVMLLPPDAQATVVDLSGGSSNMQVARGSVVTDAAGPRQATLLFPSGTEAQMVMADGTLQPISVGTVRATEFTDADLGMAALTAPLPPNTGYTYMVELSVDEANAAGASSVRFSQDVVLYLENFLDVSIGTAVPAGYYDRQRAVWVTEENGRVVHILDIVDGSAVLDVEGNGATASDSELLELGVDQDELDTLATTYSVGDSLWRTPIPHFTPWDCNWPFGPPSDAVPPPANDFGSDDDGTRRTRDYERSDEDEDTRCPGSIVGCFNQKVGEKIGVPGTPFSLYFDSQRSAGTAGVFDIRLTGSEVPTSLRGVTMEVSVGGRRFKTKYPPLPNQTYRFGNDAMDSRSTPQPFESRDYANRRLRGTVPVDFKLCYDYEPVLYEVGAGFEQAFNVVRGRLQDDSISFGGYRSDVVDLEASVRICRRWSSSATSFGIQGAVSGWELGVHHVYDPFSSTVLRGDGSRVSAKRLAPSMTSLIGPLLVPNVDPPDPRRECGDGWVGDAPPIIYDPELLYLCGLSETPNPEGFFAPKTITALAPAPDGALYVARDLVQVSVLGNRPSGAVILRVEKDGSASRIAGPGLPGFPGTTPATQFQFPDTSSYPAFAAPTIRTMKVGPDGLLYVVGRSWSGERGTSTYGSAFVLRLDGEGGYEVVFGDPNAEPMPLGWEDVEGKVATEARTNAAYKNSIAFGPDGSLYFASPNNVYRVGTDHVVTRVAGTGVQLGYQRYGLDWSGSPTEHGTKALDFEFPFIAGIEIDKEGRLHILAQEHSDWTGYTRTGIYVVGADGIIRLLVGGSAPPGDTDLYSLQPLHDDIGISTHYDMDMDSSGDLYFSTQMNVFKIHGNSLEPVVGSLPLTVPGPWPNGIERIPSWVSGMSAASNTRDTLPNLQVGYTGDLYWTHNGNEIRTASIGKVPTQGQLIPSPDGTQVWEFHSGRHLRTIDALTGQTVYAFEYDGDTKLVGIRDRHSNLTSIVRDADGEVTAIQPPFAPATQIATDQGGRISELITPGGERYEMGYDPVSTVLETFTTPTGATSTFTFDEDHHLIRDEDAVGGVQTLSRTDDPQGFEVTRSVSGIANPWYYRESIDMNGAVVTEVERPDGAVSTKTRIRGGDERYREPSTGRLALSPDLVQTSPDGTVVQTSFGPDPRFGSGAPVPVRKVVRLPSGALVSQSEERTVESSNILDPAALESLTTETQRGTLGIQTLAYDQASRTLVSTSALGRQSTVLLDSNGKVIETGIAGLFPTRVEYDSFGRVVSVSQGVGDDERRLSYTYDPSNGYLSTVQLPVPGQSLTFSSDDNGRVSSVTTPDTQQTEFRYDGMGAPIALTPPGRPEHLMSRTPRGFLDTYTAPSDGASPVQTQFTYRADRSLDAVTLPDGRTIDYLFNGDSGRLVGVDTVRANLAVDYSATTYEADTMTVSDADGVRSLHQDKDGYLTSAWTWAGPVASSGTTGFVYDQNLMLSEVQVNGEVAATYAYDLDGVLESVGAMTIERDPLNGLLIGTTLGTVSTSQSYNGFGEVESHIADISGGVLYEEAVLARDKNGRILDVSEETYAPGAAQSRVSSYAYDEVGRLSSVSVNGIQQGVYTYDGNGNRLEHVTGNSVVKGRYDAQDRLIRYCPEDGAGNAAPDGVNPCFGYDYNGTGQLQQRTELLTGDVTFFDYDEFGALHAVQSPTQTVSYILDPTGRRIGKAIDGVTTQGFLYVGALNPVAELDASGATVSLFAYGTKSHVPEYMVRAGETYRLVTDHLGSVHMVVNVDDGSVEQQLDYDEFGNVLFDTNPGFQPFGFAGGLYDADTGLVRFGARDYDPVVGRWTAKDPTLFGGGDANLYRYTGGDPVNRIDPNGLDYIVYSNAREQLYWYKDNGDLWATYDAKSGGSHLPRSRGGGIADPIPPGAYRGSVRGNDLRRRSDKKTTFDCRSKGGSAPWSLQVDHISSVENERTLLRTHPDGKRPGTEGCIGINCADSQAVQDSLRDYFTAQGNNYISITVVD